MNSSNSEERAHIEEQLRAYRFNLKKREMRAAHYGGEIHAPIDVQNDIEETRAKIEELKGQWEELYKKPVDIIRDAYRNGVIEQIFKSFQAYNGVVLHGFSGTGKTTIARKVLSEVDEFQRAIDVLGDKASGIGKPGTLSLNTVVEKVSEAISPKESLFEPAFPKSERPQRLIEHLYKKPVFLLLDNFGLENRQLYDWINHFPHDCRVMITSWNNLTNSGLLVRFEGVELKGLRDKEVGKFINQELADHEPEVHFKAQQFEALEKNTYANPKAIELIIGSIESNDEIQKIVNGLRKTLGETVEQRTEEILIGLWQNLDELAQRMLMAAALFPSSARQSAPFAATAPPETSDELLDQARDQLTKKRLLDWLPPQQSNAESRYTLHQVVRDYAQYQHAFHALWVQDAWRRLTAWVEKWLKPATWPVSNLEELKRVPDEKETIEAALAWSTANNQHESVIRIVNGIDHFYYVKGPWDTKLNADKVRIKAAEALWREPCLAMARAIAQHAQLLCTRGRSEDQVEIRSSLDKLKALQHSFAPLLKPTDQTTANVYTQIEHADAFNYINQKKYEDARKILIECDNIEPQPRSDLRIATKRWLAEAYLGEKSLDAAREAFEDEHRLVEATRGAALERNPMLDKERVEPRAVINYHLGLARIEKGAGHYNDALEKAMRVFKLAEPIEERRYTAQAWLVIAEIHVARLVARRKGEVTITPDDAKTVLTDASKAQGEAEKLFDELGLSRDRDRLRENRQELEAIRREIDSSA